MHFWKYSALGNTFAVVLTRRAVRAPRLDWVRALCHPQTGVATDGVVLLEPSRLRMHVYNADGGRAEISGNGARCAARLFFDATPSARAVLLQGDAGVVLCRRLAGHAVSVVLPPPRFASREIPARSHRPELWGERLPLPISGTRGVIVHALSVGNPQCVVWGASLPRAWEEIGAALTRHAIFPQRTNVVFARPHRKGIEVRIWERGVGPTHASGTGAAAAAVVGARLGHTPRRVAVLMTGGTMRVAWRRDLRIELVSPALLVAEGTWTGRELG
jgi:diaminopimelate epimerase